MLELKLEQYEEKKRLLIALECLYDTSKRTTDLEDVYDDINNQNVSWGEVDESLRLLKIELLLLDLEIKLEKRLSK